MEQGGMIRKKPLTRKTPLRSRVWLKRSTKRMRQGTSTPAPTVAQRARWDRARDFGCLACYLNATRGEPTLRPYGVKLEIHHLTNGARRLGHDETICLCVFHHTGTWWPFEDSPYSEMRRAYGPAYHKAKLPFLLKYAPDGGDVELLALQNSLL
jgi:hypothetical protein